MFLDHMEQLQARILVNGQFVAEFDDEDAFPSNKEKTKYIEAEAGTNFTVMVTTNAHMARHAEDCILSHVYLDGKYATNKIITTGNVYGIQWAKMDGIDRNIGSGSTKEKFQFAALQTTDAPVGNTKKADFENLGEIKVKCWWIRKKGNISEDGVNTFKSACGDGVPEKCLKGRAISSLATVGPAEYLASKVQYVNTEYIYGKDPLAMFTFKYRSRRDLQIEGLIPRSPTPVPLEERDPDDLTPEEARELVRRLRRTQQQQIEIKKEGLKKKRARSATLDADSDSEGVVITGATSSRKRARQSTDSGIELIDLTED
ncbi:hypothetical protein Slin15195_G059730 [Septoria linicola]|uniref:DUF7918 domain-containing protein n=1 Tax=Septoria linicola TaxID=215465 RepID=A0A9Q9ANQ9_9PEZI|nr:hypothetical protein Slin14017_G075590 [Septoria linicola]USW52654.1 hypothetical protein Slin15195_G059730 [Septoria linicola]